jgi:nicotinate-nucleotide adenylyltransferase
VSTVPHQPVVLFGGTFDPLHHGHLRVAWEAREAIQADDFRFVPAGVPPHRDQEVRPAAQRLEMLKRGLPPDSGFRIDDRELKRAGPSYMVDTLKEVRVESPNAAIILLIGQDSANGLDSWHRWNDLFSLAHIAVMTRAGDTRRYSAQLRLEMRGRSIEEPAQLHQLPHGLVTTIGVSSLSISSSRIRELLAVGRSPRFLLPDAVLDYILKHDVYDRARVQKT